MGDNNPKIILSKKEAIRLDDKGKLIEAWQDVFSQEMEELS